MQKRQRPNMPFFVWPNEEERKRQEQERLQKNEIPASTGAKSETYNWMNRMNAPSAVQSPVTFKDMSMRDALLAGRGPFADQSVRDYMLTFLPNALKTARTMDEATEAVHQSAFNNGTGVYSDNNVRFGTAFMRPDESQRETATGSFYRDRALLQEQRIKNAVDAGAIDFNTAMMLGRFDLLNPDQLSRAIAQAEIGLADSQKKDAAWEEYLDNTDFTGEWQRAQEEQRMRSNLAMRIGQDFAKNKGHFDFALLKDIAAFAGMPMTTVEEINAVNAYAHSIAQNPQAFIAETQAPAAVDEYKSRTSYYENYLDMLNAEKQKKEASAGAAADPEWETRSQYVDRYNGDYSSRFTYDTSPTFMQNMFGLRYANSQEDDLYNYINSTAFQNEYEKEALATGTTYGDNNMGYNSVFGQAGYHLLTDDEKKEFNVRWSQETTGPEEAKAYLESLKPKLMKRRADVQKAAAETFAEEAPGAAFALSGGARLADVGFVGARLMTAAMGEDGNSIWSDLNRFSSNVDARQLEMAAEAMPWEIPFTNLTAGEALLGTLQSGRDNTLRYLASFFFGGSSTAASTLNQILGSSTAVNSYLAQADSSDPTGNVVKALAAGAIEYATEKMGFDALFGDRNELAKHIAAYFAEGGEEITSSAVNTFVDELYAYLTGSQSELEKAQKQNLLYYRNEQDAARATTADWLKSLAGDFLIGTLSGAGMVAASDVQNHNVNVQTGTRVLENDAADHLLALAEAMPEGSESRKVAENIRKRMKPVTKMEAKQAEAKPEVKQEAPVKQGKTDVQAQAEQAVSKPETTTEAKPEAPAETAQNAPQEAAEEQTTNNTQEAAQAPETKETPKKKGKRISPAKLGQLYRTLYNDLDAQGKQTVSGVMQSSVKERLTALGEDPASANEVAEPLAKLLADGTLTNREKQVIARSTNAMRVFNEIRFAEDDTYSSNWVGEAGKAAAEATADNTDTRAELERMLAPKVLRPAVEAAQRTVAESGMAVANAKHGTDAKLGVQLTDEDGKTQDAEILQVTGVTKQGMQVKVKGSDGQTKTVDMADMKFANSDTATIAAYIQKAPHVFTAEEANKMLQTYMGGDVQEHISGFTTLYDAGYAGRSIPPSKLPQAQVIYDLGKQDAATDEANRLKGIGTGKRGTGKVTFAPGVIKEKIDKRQRMHVYAVRALAKAGSMNFVLFDSQTMTDGSLLDDYGMPVVNGTYNRKTNTMFIDLSSGKTNEDSSAPYAILRSVSHELTHFMEFNSAEGYAKLKDFVKSEYARKGKSWDKLVEDELKNAAMAMDRETRAAAEGEVIAKAMEMMLQDSKAIERLAQRDQSLYARMKKFIQEYFRKVREAFELIRATSTEAALLLEQDADGIMRYAEKMTKLWDDALVEAVENVQAMGETITADEAEAEMSETMRILSGLRDGDGNLSFSFKSMQEDYQTYKKMLVTAGATTDEIDDLFDTIDAVMKKVGENRTELDFGENIGRDDRSFLPVKPNSDPLYKVSLDFSSLCRKRLLQQAVQERLEAKYETVLTKAERVAIRQELLKLQQEGLKIEVACALCYVEAARLKSPAQIAKFMDNKRAQLVDFFSKNSDSYKKAIDAKVAEMTEKLGYEAGTPMAQMSKADKRKVQAEKKAMYTKYMPTEAEKRIIRTAEDLPETMYKTSEGLWKLKREHPEIFAAYTTFVRNATKSKGIEGDTPFYAGDSQTISDGLIESMNAENGLRSQSWSDFQVIHVLDYMAAIIEFSTRKAKMQSYTKVPDFVKLMGNTGMMINLSLIPSDYDGKNLTFDPVEGMDYAVSKTLRDVYHGTVGNISIGISDPHIKALLASNDIDYVIPYHKSSMDKKTRAAIGLKKWEDYEASQNEKQRDYSETDKNSKQYRKAPKFSEWYNHEEAMAIAKAAQATAPSGDVAYGARVAMQEMAERYKQLCHERGLQEKFAQFASEENYWKLLIDRKMIDQVTGELIEQKAVKPVFNTADTLAILDAEVERFAPVKADFKKAASRIEEMWANGEIRKAAKSKEIQKQVSDYEDTVVVRNIVESAAEPVNTEDLRFSRREFDKAQTETQQFKKWFGKSKVVNADGSPKVVYHQTAADFTVFDNSNPVAGLNDSGTPNGFFFKDNNHDIGLGAKQMAVYLKMEKPLHFHNRDEANAWYMENVPGYSSLRKEYDAVVAEFKPKFKAIEEEQFSNWTSDERLDELFNMEEELIKQMGTVEDKYRGKLRDLLDAYFLSGKSGYDGIEFDYTGHTWMNGVREKIHTYIVFKPAQIKSATDNVGTFDPDSQDIRYSRREVTPHTLAYSYMETMQPTTSMNESERWLLSKYQRTVKELQEKQEAYNEQRNLAVNGTSAEERTKAKARANLLDKQMGHLQETLRKAERSEGFATLMNTAQKVAERFMTDENNLLAADASDRLDNELADVQAQLKAITKQLANAETGQRTAFAKGLFNAKALNEAGQTIRKAFNTRMSGKEISNRLALAYAELYAENNPERFAAAMRALAQDVLESSKSRYRSPVLADLKDNIGSIGLSEAQKQELVKNGITISDFKRVVNPVVQVIDGGANLGTIVSSAEYYGTGIISQLSSADSEGDMIMTLYDTIRDERAKETEATMEGMTHEESIGYTMAEIMNTANFPLAENGANLDALRSALTEGIEGNRAIATQVDKALATAKRASASAGNLWRKAAEINSAGKQAVEYYRAIDEQRRLLEQEELVLQLKSEAAQELKKQRQDFRDRMDRDRRVRDMNMKATQHRKHLAAQVKKLDGLIRHETDYKHVPEDLKPLVETLVSAFANKGAGIVFDKKKADRLAEVYRKLEKADGTLAQYAMYYDPDILAHMEELGVLLERELQTRNGAGMALKERAAEKLAVMENLADIADNVYKMVKDANNLFYGGKKVEYAKIGTEAANEMNERPDHKQLAGKAGKWLQELDNFVRKGNMTPVYFFDQLKNTAFKTLFGDMLAGQEVYAKRMYDARQYMQETREQYHYDTWANDDKLTMTTEQGHKITLDKEQAMSLYAMWKREHADELLPSYHLEEGGFVYESSQLPTEGKGLKKVVQRTTPSKLTKADMAQIEAYLTAEQKAYADAVVNYMSTTMAEYGNETSMELYGIRKYKEDYYFPFKSDSNQMHQSSTSGGGQVTDDNRLKHRSFTKARVRSAANALVLGNFSEVAANHMVQMILYSSMTTSIESMNRVLNYKTTLEDGSQTTIRALLEQKYGTNMKKYLETFLSDMNGGVRRDSREADLAKLMSLFKRGAVMASLSVVVQQPTSILRATAMLDPKYLAKTHAKKGSYDELKNHSGVAILKEMGRFDMDMGVANADWLLEADEGMYKAWQRVHEAAGRKDWAGARETAGKSLEALLTAAPGKADEMTWSWLWEAVKAEQAEANPGMNTSSEAFLDLCGERFNDIVNHTQVYDSTLVRSQSMRSKSGLMQMATSFMAEPTLTANMLYDAIANNASRGGKKYAVRAAVAVLASQLATALAQALVSAGRDKDEKKTWAEKYAGKAAANIASNLNPMNMLPVLSDIQSLLDGYDVTRADMSIFAEIKKAFDKLGNENMSAWEKVDELTGSLAKLVGIPYKNISRDIKAMWTTFFGNADRPTSGYAVGEAVKGGLIPGYDTKPEAYYERAYQAMNKGDQATVGTIREYMTTVGGKDDNDIDNGIRNRLKLRVDNGEMSKDEAIRWLVEHKLAKNTREAFDEVDKWTDTKAYRESVDDYSYKKYGEIEMALKKGDTKTVKTLMDEMLKYGNKEDDVISAIKTSIGNLYKNGELTKAEATKLYKHYDPKADDEDIFWLHDKWDLTKKNADVDGYSWTKTGAFLDSIPNGGKTMVSEAKKLLDNGVKKGNISSAIKNRYKDQFVELYKKGQAANLLARLLSAYEAIGYNRGAMQNKIMSWLTEDEEE